MHTLIALLLRNDLSSVLDNDLIRLKGAIWTYPVPTINGLHDLDANIVFSTCLASVLQFCKGAVGAQFRANVAIAVIAFVEHKAVHAVFAAAGFRATEAG